MNQFEGRPALGVGECVSVTLGCLTRPISVGAILLLVVNDHVLKREFPSWLTGKLSDVAGLYFAPALGLLMLLALAWFLQYLVGQAGRLAGRNWVSGVTLTRAQAEALSLTISAAIGTAFAAIKLSPATAESVLTPIRAITGVAYAPTVDPSDILALGVVPLAYARWQRRLALRLKQPSGTCRSGAPAARPLRRVGQVAIVVAASLATLATSPAPPPAMKGIVAHPTQPGILYALHGNQQSRQVEHVHSLYRTTNGGETWGRYGGLFSSDPPPDSASPLLLYLALPDGVVRFGETRPTLRYVWPAFGSSWRTEVGDDAPPVPMTTPDWADGVVYVGARGAVMRTPDSGVTWEALPLPGPSDEPITAVAAAPNVVALLYAAKARQLFRSPDGGASWEHVADLDFGPTMLRVDPTENRRLIAGSLQGLHTSRDGGVTWRATWRHLRAAGPVWTIVFDLSDQRTAYAAIRRLGLLASHDLGDSWSEWLSADAYGVAVTQPPDRRVYIAVGGAGLLRRRESLYWPWLGEWERINEGLEGTYPTRLSDRLLNLMSWLGTLALGLVALLRLPGRPREVLRDHPWEAALALWTLVPAGLLLWGLITGSGFEATLPIALAAPASLVLLAKTPASRPVWGLVALPCLLISAFEDHGLVVLGGALPLLPIVVAVVLVASWRALGARRSGAARSGLMLAIVVANAPAWLVLLIASAFGRVP